MYPTGSVCTAFSFFQLFQKPLSHWGVSFGPPCLSEPLRKQGYDAENPNCPYYKSLQWALASKTQNSVEYIDVWREQNILTAGM